MRRKYWVIIVLIAVCLIAPSMASGNIEDFHINDPADTALADFDIISFGANVQGTYIDFWISVRGNINTYPEDGYLNGYVIHISDGNEDITMAAMWLNMSNKIHSYIYLTTPSGTKYLNKSNYEISGNRIDFLVSAILFKNIDDARAETINAKSNSPSSTAWIDIAIYGENSNGGNPYSVIWIVIVIIFVSTIAILVIVLNKRFIQ